MCTNREMKYITKPLSSHFWHAPLLYNVTGNGVLSGICCRRRGIPAMVNLYSLLSSGQPRLSACTSVPVQRSYLHRFVNDWVCLSNELLNRKNFFCLSIWFLPENFQGIQNLENIVKKIREAIRALN